MSKPKSKDPIMWCFIGKNKKNSHEMPKDMLNYSINLSGKDKEKVPIKKDKKSLQYLAKLFKARLINLCQDVLLSNFYKRLDI